MGLLTEDDIRRLPDDVIRSVILAWDSIGSPCDPTGAISARTCREVRERMLREPMPDRLR